MWIIRNEVISLEVPMADVTQAQAISIEIVTKDL